MTSINFSLACIGGSHSSKLLEDRIIDATRLGSRKTPFGVSQPIYVCRNSAGRFYLLLRHSDGKLPLASSFANHRANIFALKELGVTHIVSINSARAVSHNYRVGQFVLTDDLIDETKHRIGTFFENGLRIELRQWPVFCPTLRSGLATVLQQTGVKFSDHGTYLCSEGPRRETCAEVRKYALWGADLLGHSLAPEAFLAKELQLCYASLCIINDFAETGSIHRPYEAESLFQNITPAKEDQKGRDPQLQMPGILQMLISILPQIKTQCSCQTNLDHLIEAGLLSKDFHDWFPKTKADDDKKIMPIPLQLPPSGRTSDKNIKV